MKEHDPEVISIIAGVLMEPIENILKENRKMERQQLLEEWVKTLADKMKTADFSEEQKAAVLEVLGSVFEVGRQTGVDEEKLRVQLEQLGKPYGHE